jgi:argininosuccinate synthase
MFEVLKPVKRWSFRRKAEVLWALRHGLITVADVQRAYGVTSEELLQWNRDHAILGVEWGLHPQAPNPLHPLVSLAWSSST